MLAIFLLNLVLSLNPMVAFAPTVLYATLRFDKPVLGEVCLQAEAISDNAQIFYRETCEGINGTVKQIRWPWPWSGEYRMRATYKGGTERITTQYQIVTIKPRLGG